MFIGKFVEDYINSMIVVIKFGEMDYVLVYKKWLWKFLLLYIKLLFFYVKVVWLVDEYYKE